INHGTIAAIVPDSYEDNYKETAMFWFKNVLVYRLTKKLDWSTENLQQSLALQQFFPCGAGDRTKLGWQAPLAESEMFHFEVSGQILLVAHKEEKMLPSNVVKETLEN